MYSSTYVSACLLQGQYDAADARVLELLQGKADTGGHWRLCFVLVCTTSLSLHGTAQPKPYPGHERTTVALLLEDGCHVRGGRASAAVVPAQRDGPRGHRSWGTPSQAAGSSPRSER
jgi:hypothetical protein